MAEPRGRLFGQLGDCAAPTVWTVDDDWFEGVGALSSLARRTEESDLQQLIEAITSVQGRAEAAVTGPIQSYLKTLAQHCLARGLNLYVCNFECFQERFAYANQPGHAVLLDVMKTDPRPLPPSFAEHVDHSESASDPAHVYGVHLLASLLRGKRFRGDVFFVTQALPIVAKEIRACLRHDATWWPLKGLGALSINKERVTGGDPGRELETFFRFFVGGLPPALRQPDFDVKYVALVAVAPLIGRLDETYATSDSLDEFSPFIVPLIKEFGASASLVLLGQAIKEGRANFVERAASAIAREVVQNCGRWGAFIEEVRRTGVAQATQRLTGVLVETVQVEEDDSCRDGKVGLLRKFASLIDALPEIEGFLTLEDWALSNIAPTLNERIREAVHEFGGATRFNMLRGTWVQRGEAVDDLLIGFEFLTRRSRVSREIMETQIVAGLLDIDGEDEAIVQEIPLAAYSYRR